MIRKYLLPVLAIIGVGITVLMVMKGNRTPSVAQPVVQSARAPFASYIFGPGIVEASTENIAIGTPVSGIVTAVYVKWGDRVSTGDPLFKVDSSDLQAQLPPALAKVKEAETNLAKVKNRLRVGESMSPGISISVEDIDNRRLDVAINEAALASAEAQVEQIKTEIERRTVRARLPGRILQMKTRLGEYAQSGPLSTPLMLLGNDDRLHVRVDVDENDAWRFHPCASAIASVRGNPELKTPMKFEHTEPDVVPRVSLTGDSTQRVDSRVLQVIYSFDRGSVPVYVGQQMDVFIEVSSDAGKKPDVQTPSGTCGDDATRNRRPAKPGRRKS
jgi:RND family efflux transporter MFP subunit